MMCRIAAIVVTYNRRDKLLRCIEAIMKQTAEVRPDIFVVDNGSSDGTEEAVGFMRDRLSPEDAGRILYSNLRHNSGGAGGFCYGLRKAAEAGYDFVWLMDDDCIPSDTALEELLKYEAGHHGEYGFLSSRVLWTDGSVHRMNRQKSTITRTVCDGCGGPTPVELASFVSLLIPASIVEEIGLPFRQFFMWTDDWEYTRRISGKYPCLMIPDSIVVHDTDKNAGADISTAKLSELDRFRRLYRNDVYLYRREGLKGFCYEALRLPLHLVKIALSRDTHSVKNKKAEALVKGTLEGMRFFPEPDRALMYDKTEEK